MSQHLDKLAIGDTIDMRGPSGLLVYNGGGEFGVKAKKTAPAVPLRTRHVGMIAGGTGT